LGLDDLLPAIGDEMSNSVRRVSFGFKNEHSGVWMDFKDGETAMIPWSEYERLVADVESLSEYKADMEKAFQLKRSGK
jgi:hypothetical protein